MFLRSIAKLDFSSIVLETTRTQNNDESNLAIINASFIQASSNISEANSQLENLHLRVVASYTEKSSQFGDFTCQRFNEYNNLDEANAEFGDENTSEKFVRFLQEDIADTGFLFLEQANPFSPFSTDRAVIPRMFTNQVSSEGTPPGITLFDDLLIDLMPRSAMAGQPLLERSIASTRVRTQEVDGEPLDNSTQLLDRVSLNPILIDLSSVSSDIKDNLTFYMFVYDAGFAAPGERFELPEISLVTEMSKCIAATVVGDHTTWNAISVARPYVGLGNRLPTGRFQNTVVTTAPDAAIFQHINLIPSDNVVLRVTSIFDRVYDQLAKTILDEKPEIKKIISKDNYFSEFWISKDSDENHRFSFAFDLESYLIANSYFPFLYRSQNLSRQVINQTGFMRNSKPSEVLDMKVLRRFVSEDATMPVNRLTTSGHLVETGPNITFPEKVIESISKIPDLYLDQQNEVSTPNKISFYEGKDSFSTSEKYSLNTRDTQINGVFMYGADYTVYDAAPIFMRNLVLFLMNMRSGVEHVFDTIVNSVPSQTGYTGGIVEDGRDLFRPETRTLNVPLWSISGKIDGEQVIFHDYLISTIQVYQEVINDLAPLLTGNFLDEYYSFIFRLNQGLIDPLVIKDVQNLIDIGIQMLFRKLTEIFPNDPLGRGLDISVTSPLEGRGVCQRKFPILRGRHFFDETYKKGKDLGYGYDFIFDKEPDNGQRNGISRISFPEYETRVGEEFTKYFQISGELSDFSIGLLPQGVYRNPGYSYFTSKTIRTPMNADLDQTKAAAQEGTPVSNYNLDEYARVFADIIDLNYMIKNRQVNPLITPGRRLRVSANEELYTSVVKVLEEQYAVEIKTEDILPQYTPPRVSTGEYEPTVDNKVKIGTIVIQNGPLAIPTLIGGLNNVDPTTLTYFSDVNTSLSNESLAKQKGYMDQEIKRRRENKTPIKLPFAIFGELSVDSEIDLDTTYEQKEFNSMVSLTNILGTRGDDLATTLENGTVAGLPNQLKNMILITSTDQRITLGDFPTQFEACRPYLEDKDSATPGQLLSYFNPGEQSPPFPETNDPLKIYAKFLAFWMNYKQIARIEYLHAFGSLDASDIFYSDIPQAANPEILDNTYVQKTKLPVWRILNPDFVQDVLKDGRTLFCRVKIMAPLDYRNLLAGQKQPILDTFSESFRNKEPLELPMYNKYFLLGVSTPEETPKPEPKPEPKRDPAPDPSLVGAMGI